MYYVPTDARTCNFKEASETEVLNFSKTVNIISEVKMSEILKTWQRPSGYHQCSSVVAAFRTACAGPNL